MKEYISEVKLKDDVKLCNAILDKYKNLKSLGFDCNKIALRAQKASWRGWKIRSQKQFEYNFAYVLTFGYYNIIKNHYLPILDRQVGTVLKSYPKFTPKLLRIFLRNFADAGFELALCEFFIGQKIKILDIEFDHPYIKKGLDIKIELNGRECFIETTSPIPSIIRASITGKDASKIVQKVISDKSHSQLSQLKKPAILAINYSDPAWCRNIYNNGEVTNPMFYSIKETIINKGTKIPKEISLLLIKSGDKAFCMINEDASYPLTKDDIRALKLAPFWKKVLYGLFSRD